MATEGNMVVKSEKLAAVELVRCAVWVDAAGDQMQH